MDRTEQLYDIFKRHGEVTTDSRCAGQNSIFFALKGDNFDGNEYAGGAIAKGASLAVVDNASVIEEGGREKYFLVDDVQEMLQELAALHRRKLGIPILAVTGSNGKTTTKELVVRVLSQKYRVAATKGNLNNHIGVPLTLLSMDGSVEFGVVEMGANHRGEIELLCKIARPDYGIITNVGKSHLEGFGGIEGVIKGKGELYDHLEKTGGTAIYRQDNDVLSKMVSQRPRMKTSPYSMEYMTAAKGAGELMVVWNKKDAGTDTDIIINTHLWGDYNLYNVAAAAAIGKYFGTDPLDTAHAIAGYIPDNNRSQSRLTKNNTLVLDAYNANPTSMEFAIENFARIGTGMPKALILGDMLELGEYTRFEHLQIINLIQSKGFGEVYLTGKNFFDAAQSMGATGNDIKVFKTTDELAQYLSEHKIKSRLILIKGSRGIHLEQITELL